MKSSPSNHRWSSIDIGTNTVLYLCADVKSPHSIQTVAEAQRIIRLGKNVDSHKNIQTAGLEKCVQVLTEYRQYAMQHQSEKVIAAGTSALRDAKNRNWFLAEIRKRTGINIEVLSGDEEALCTYQGGRLILNENNHNAKTLVIDVGGGSTELILGDSEQIHSMTSIDIGAVRLTERFLRHDPVLPEEETSMRRYIHEHLERGTRGFLIPPQTITIGVAGTITTLAAMNQRLDSYQPGKINGYPLDRESVDSILRELRQSTLEDKKKLKGLEPERADVIFAGTVIIDEIMDHFCQREMIVSNYGLRYGLMIREYKKLSSVG